MADKIPEKSRLLVKTRDQHRCVRCSSPQASEWHHRRSRSVRDDATHQPQNGVWLCLVCHAWAHAHPFEAKASGLIVSRHSDPAVEPVEHALYGRVLLTENGGYQPV